MTTTHTPGSASTPSRIDGLDDRPEALFAAA